MSGFVFSGFHRHFLFMAGITVFHLDYGMKGLKFFSKCVSLKVNCFKENY